MISEKPSFSVQLSSWSGPLDLLLKLIDKSKIKIEDISIEEITEQYIASLHNMEKLNLDVASEFLVVAVRLLYIKSKTFLFFSKEDSQENVDDFFGIYSKENLVDQLLNYQQYKEASNVLENRNLQTLTQFMDRKERQTTFLQELNKKKKQDEFWEEVGLFDLLKVFSKVMDNIPTKITQHTILRDEKYTVKMKVEQVYQIFHSKEEIHFFDLFSNKPSKEEIIVCLWAILELFKLSCIEIKQHKIFGDIILFKGEVEINIENFKNT